MKTIRMRYLIACAALAALVGMVCSLKAGGCWKDVTGICLADGTFIDLVVPQGLPCGGQVVTMKIIGDAIGDSVDDVGYHEWGKHDIERGGYCPFHGAYVCQGAIYEVDGWTWGKRITGYACTLT